MGYYAHGSGVLKLKSEVPEDVLALLSWENAGFSEVADSPDGGLWLTFEHSKFHDDDMVHAMNKIAQYVESGDVEFCGEDDCHWRFHFCNGKVEEQNGEVEYKGGKRTFNVCYYHSEGSNEAQFDIDDDDFAVMMNELIALTRQVADESNEQNIEIYRIEEVPYDGE